MLNVTFDFVFIYCNTKITKAFFLFSACMFWYVVLFGKKLIALQHGDNTFLFDFAICIKLTLSVRILTMEKW